MDSSDKRYDEKRCEKRYDRRLAIVGTIRRSDDNRELEGSPIKCESVNISEHGIQFRSDLQLSPGTLVSVSVAYTPREIYTVNGLVRWCRMEDGEPTIGIELQEADDSDFNKWLDLLRSGLN